MPFHICSNLTILHRSKMRRRGGNKKRRKSIRLALKKNVTYSMHFFFHNATAHLLQSFIFLGRCFRFFCKEDVCVLTLPWFTHVQKSGLEFCFFLQVLHTSVGKIWNSTISEKRKRFSWRISNSKCFSCSLTHLCNFEFLLLKLTVLSSQC